ncbi:hypothetical protein Y032_0081g1486 [Ancylostoma ceylanicum]|nr:hypothetical protein Y032_0081g1486 [Ancylostoma ceylanicum]
MFIDPRRVHRWKNILQMIEGLHLTIRHHLGEEIVTVWEFGMICKQCWIPECLIMFTTISIVTPGDA